MYRLGKKKVWKRKIKKTYALSSTQTHKLSIQNEKEIENNNALSVGCNMISECLHSCWALSVTYMSKSWKRTIIIICQVNNPTVTCWYSTQYKPVPKSPYEFRNPKSSFPFSRSPLPRLMAAKLQRWCRWPSTVVSDVRINHL